MINKGYPETHQQGIISIENMPLELSQNGWTGYLGNMIGDFGIQVAPDGRVWVCINGIAFLRFKPHTSNLIVEAKRK